MYLKVYDEDCWVIAPTERELRALRQLDKYDRRISGVLLPLSLIVLLVLMVVAAGFSQSIFGSMIIGCLAVAPAAFLIFLHFFGFFRFGLRKTYSLMKRNCRIVPLWGSPVGIALRDHVLFYEDWELRLMWQQVVLERYSDADPSALDDFLADPDNYHVLSKLLAVNSDSPAYDLYRVTLLRRAHLVVESMRPFVEPMAATERTILAEQRQKTAQALLEKQQRQLAEARAFSLLDSAQNS